MASIHVYIDDSYWKNGDALDRSAISFLGQCLVENIALFDIHFNNIGEDIDKDFESAMLGTEGTPIFPISILINQLRNGKGKDDLVLENNQEYNKSFFIRLYTNNNYKWAIIFSKDPAIKSLEQEYGYGIINEHSIEEFKVNVIKKNESVDQHELVSDIKKCNSVVVVDRFSLKNDSTIDNNLLFILNKIKSGTKITLTILSQFTYQDGQGLSIQQAFDKIKRVCPNWNIEIYDIGDIYHDRFIITNNNYITIGGGLDCYKISNLNRVGSKTTTIHKYQYPLFQKEISKEVIFYIKDISHTIRTINDRTKKRSNFVNGTYNCLVSDGIEL
jgi:hypothetical protein